MHPILMTFLALYGNASSGYNLEGDPENDEPLTVTIHFPMQPDRVFRCEPASDDDGFWHFMMDDCMVTVLVPYADDQPDGELDTSHLPMKGYAYRDYPGQG